MTITYKILEFMSWYTTQLFFRDITIINMENVPTEGPTIIYGNHNNQFVDGLVKCIAI